MMSPIIHADQQGKGKPIGENDSWIAATAITTEATLVTKNRDFGKLPGRLD